MKKIIWFGALCAVFLCLCSCAQSSPVSTPPPLPAPTAAPTPSPSPTPSPQPTLSPDELRCLEEQEALRCVLQPLQIGDIFAMGSYGQEETAAIEWQVLDRQGDRLFVISRYVLELVAFHDRAEDVTWETSSVRRWLNEDFFSSAFSEAEQSFIPVVTFVTEDNPFVLTEGGNDTEDRLALPSLDELHRCLSWEPRRRTKYAFNGKQAWYWMRNMGIDLQEPAYISYDGTFNYTAHEVTEAAGVRPVMYVDVG